MSSPFQSAVAVTPHDSNENKFRALYVAGGAAAVTITVKPQGSASNVQFTIPINQSLYIPCAVDLVLDTGTDATAIVGFN